MQEDIKVYRKHKIPGLLINFLNDRDLVKRLLFTLFIIFIVRMAFLIPAPGVNTKAIIEFYNQINIRQGYKASSMLLSGTQVKFSLFSLGLMPYISACFLLQIIGAIYSPLRKKYFGGEEGRRKIVIYTYVLAVLLSLLQAFYMSKWLERPENFGGINVAYFTGWSFRVTITISLVCGVVFLVWLGNLITERGIGNGIPVLILASIVSTIPAQINRVMYLVSMHSIHWFSPILRLLMLVGLLIFVVLITRSSIKIPITYKEGISKKLEYINLRFSMVAKVPLSFATSVLLFPATIGGFLPYNVILQKISIVLTPGKWIYLILCSLFILFFTYVYMSQYIF